LDGVAHPAGAVAGEDQYPVSLTSDSPVGEVEVDPRVFIGEDLKRVTLGELSAADARSRTGCEGQGRQEAPCEGETRENGRFHQLSLSLP
jgi:hypothetical protein